MLPIYIISLLFVGYSSLILYYWRAWKAIPNFIRGKEQPVIPVTLIVCARNEEENIGRLLNCIAAQDYPSHLLEVIVVDDHSTDRTAAIVKEFSFARLLPLLEDVPNSYKKKAIETAMRVATGELIVTTDADCFMGTQWISSLVEYYQQFQPVFIAAPVDMTYGNRLLDIFQAYDFAVLQGITGASVNSRIHSMCNGANMAYTREAFHAVDGFTGIDHIASGDDLLLMHKIAERFPGRIGYLKSRESIVSTHPMKSWKAFFHQRIRWASKATHYRDGRLIATLLLVYIFNLSFLVLAIAGCWHPMYWFYLLALWLGKTVVEFPFVRSVASFFGKQGLLKYFFLLQPLHIVYTISSGLISQFGKYEWKGRRVR